MMVAPRHCSHPDCRAPLSQIDAPQLDDLAGLWATCPKSARKPASPETGQQRRYVIDWARRHPSLSPTN